MIQVVRSLFITTLGVVFLVVAGLVGFVLLLDLISLGASVSNRSKLVDEDLPSTQVERYANKISNYSLVKVRALKYVIGHARENIDRRSGLYSCIGEVWKKNKEWFVDLSALTISILAIENYNRNWFRRMAEIYARDVIRAMGIFDDYTIGIAQIKRSLAEAKYRSYVDSHADENTIDAFAKSDCGSAYLASLIIDEYVDECSKKLGTIPANDVNSTIECVVQKYTGMAQRSRLLAVYSTAVTLSYGRLFDRENASFAAQFNDYTGIEKIREKSCIAFSPRRWQLPAQKEQEDKSTQADEGTQPKRMVAKIVPSTEDKIVPSTDNGRGKQGSVQKTIRDKRIREIIRYVCGQHRPYAIDIYKEFRYLPADVQGVCEGKEDDNSYINKEDSYIVLVVDGAPGSGGATSHLCPELPGSKQGVPDHLSVAPNPQGTEPEMEPATVSPSGPSAQPGAVERQSRGKHAKRKTKGSLEERVRSYIPSAARRRIPF